MTFYDTFATIFINKNNKEYKKQQKISLYCELVEWEEEEKNEIKFKIKKKIVVQTSCSVVFLIASSLASLNRRHQQHPAATAPARADVPVWNC